MVVDSSVLSKEDEEDDDEEDDPPLPPPETPTAMPIIAAKMTAAITAKKVTALMETPPITIGACPVRADLSPLPDLADLVICTWISAPVLITLFAGTPAAVAPFVVVVAMSGLDVMKVPDDDEAEAAGSTERIASAPSILLGAPGIVCEVVVVTVVVVELVGWLICTTTG